jgi:hypothetical protein
MFYSKANLYKIIQTIIEKIYSEWETHSEYRFQGKFKKS